LERKNPRCVALTKTKGEKTPEKVISAGGKGRDWRKSVPLPDLCLNAGKKGDNPKKKKKTEGGEGKRGDLQTIGRPAKKEEPKKKKMKNIGKRKTKKREDMGTGGTIKHDSWWKKCLEKGTQRREKRGEKEKEIKRGRRGGKALLEWKEVHGNLGGQNAKEGLREKQTNNEKADSTSKRELYQEKPENAKK